MVFHFQMEEQVTAQEDDTKQLKHDVKSLKQQVQILLNFSIPHSCSLLATFSITIRCQTFDLYFTYCNSICLTIATKLLKMSTQA